MLYFEQTSVKNLIAAYHLLALEVGSGLNWLRLARNWCSGSGFVLGVFDSG